MTSASVEAKKTFQFDRAFQEKIVQALLTDRQWAAQMAEVIDIEYFDYAYLKHMTDNYLNYYKVYKEFPSLELFISVIKTKLSALNDAVLAEQIITVIKNTKIKKDLGDLQYVKEAAISFCKQQGFKNALVQCAELVKSEDQYERAIEIVKKSISAGQVQSPGMVLDEDIDARYSETYRNTIRTNICQRTANWVAEIDGVSLDSRKILNGGAGGGELCVVIAPTGVGKSHFLVHVGAQAISQGKSVLHFTFELNERAVGIRYDSHLLGMDSLECSDRREEIKDFYKSNAGNLGKLRVKYLSTGTATVNTLRAFIDKLATDGFKPDMVIVDYAGIMRSSERYELPRMELKKIYEELRSLAADLDLPIWTACQSNKEGSQADIITLSNMSEAYSQAHICDFVIGLGRPESQKSSGMGTIFIAKNRNGIDGESFKVRINTAQSRISLLNEEDTKALSQEDAKEAEDTRKTMRKVFEDMKKDKALKDSGLKLETN